MAQEKTRDNRKPSTILAMDVASNSEKMGADEEGMRALSFFMS